MHFVSMSQSATHSELFPFEELLNSFLALPILQFLSRLRSRSETYVLLFRRRRCRRRRRRRKLFCI